MPQAGSRRRRLRVEGQVARRRDRRFEIGAVGDQQSAAERWRAAPASGRRSRRRGDVQHVGAVDGVERDPPASATGRHTSSSSGGPRLGSPARATRSAIAGSMPASASLGCQSTARGAAANQAACWPVPEAISRAAPRAPRTRRSTSRMGCLLRSAAALVGRSAIRVGREVGVAHRIATSAAAHATSRQRLFMRQTPPLPLRIRRGRRQPRQDCRATDLQNFIGEWRVVRTRPRQHQCADRLRNHFDAPGAPVAFPLAALRPVGPVCQGRQQAFEAAAKAVLIDSG